MSRITSFLAGFLCVAGSFPSLAAEPPPPPVPALPIPQSFGVNTHFIGNGVEENIALIKGAGLGWIRTDLFWGKTELTPGKYDFGNYDRLIEAAHAAGLHVVLTLDYGNKNYDGGDAPTSVEGRAAYVRFIIAAARRYAGKGVIWEIWNEPNIDPFWKPHPDVAHYIDLANEATQALREAVPDAVVMGPVLSGPYSGDWQQAKVEAFFRAVMASPAAHQWSAVTVHPYRFKGATPESAAPQIEQFRAIMKENGIDPAQIPLIASEWGYSSVGRNLSDPLQAAYAVREFLFATVQHMPFTIWYDWQDDGAEAGDEQNRFGLVHYGAWKMKDPAEVAKPAFAAVRQAGEMLRGYSFETLVRNDDAVAVASFLKGAQRLYVVWAKNNQDVDVALDLPHGDWSAQLILGDKTRIAGADKAVVAAKAMPTVVFQ